MNQIKLIVTVVLLILTSVTYANAIFTIIPSITSTTIRSDSYTVIPYTVTNTSNKVLAGITINPNYKTNSHLFISGNTCVSLIPGSSCTFNLIISGLNQPNIFVASPKVCAFNMTACSQPTVTQRIVVNVNKITHPSRAYVGLSNNTIYPIILVPNRPGILGLPLFGFNLSEPAGIALNNYGTLAYVTNSGTNTVSVIDTNSNQVVNKLKVGVVPAAVVVSPDSTKLYVANYNNGQFNGTISVLNALTGAFLATIPIGNGPWGLAIKPDGTLLYATNSFDNTVSVINTLTNRVIQTIPVGTTPLGIAATPDGTKVYVVNTQSNTVSVINTNSNQVIATINVGMVPKGIAISPNSSTAYVTNWQSGTVNFINTATNQITSTINLVSGLLGVAISPDGTQVYVTLDQISSVVVINTITRAVQYVPIPSPQVTMGNFIG